MDETEKRLLKLLVFIGYCVEFPVQLTKRIGGHSDWNRHVMYRAIREEYAVLYRWSDSRHVYRSLHLTQKGLDYIAERNPEAMAMVCARMNRVQRIYPSRKDRILRLHSVATGVVMARAAGAVIAPTDKPSLLQQTGLSQDVEIDEEMAYYYSPQEIRASFEELDDRTVAKGSRLIGIIVRGHCCYCMYHAGFTRMYWMRLTEENNAAAIQAQLNARGFHISTLSQIVIGNNMSVAVKLCHSPDPYGGRYFVVSHFFNNCHFITNNREGDELLRMIIRPELTLQFNRKVLAPYLPPRGLTRDYDAVEAVSNRPVILNYTCDLLSLSSAGIFFNGFYGGPIMLCLDYQAQTLQRIAGPTVLVRPIQWEGEYEKP